VVWLEENYTGHWSDAFLAVRFARNAKEIRKAQITTKADAVKLVKVLDSERRASERDPNPQALVLREQGLNTAQIAKTLEVGRSTVERWLDPKRVERENTRTATRRKAAVAALRKVEREAQRKAIAARVKGDGSPLSEAYANVRKAAQMLEFARTNQPKDAEAILPMQDALYRVEDDLGNLLRGRR
jgi:predicted transcriptional regulator